MVQCSDVRMENRRLIKEAYLSLRSTNIEDKSAVQRLEALLSTSILKAEELILRSKRNSDTGLEAAYRECRAVLKRIADGLTWNFFGFDEHLLRVYAMGHPSGFMAGKTGCLSERRVIEAAYQLPEVRFAIQNDITNVLRVADVTLLLSDGVILPIEVKASHKSAYTERAKRQMKRYNAIQAYLREGISEEVEIFGEPLRSLEVPLEYNYYWKELEQAAFKALIENFAWRVCDDGLLIVCYRRSVEPNLYHILEYALRDTQWASPSIRFGCLSRHLDPQENDILKYVIPVTSFEIDPSVIVELLLGELEVTILVNVDRVEEMFKKVGFETEVSPEGGIKIKALSGTQLGIRERPWNWLVYGLLTLPSFINMVTSSLVEAERRFL